MMKAPLLYVVDDEEVAREGVALALRRLYRVRDFPAAEPALAAINDHPPDLTLLDIGLPGMDGLEALRRIKAGRPEALVVMITAFEDVRSVVTAMKLGAYDYVVKPLNMDGLMVTVRNALETMTLRHEIQALQENCLRENLPGFIAESDAIQDVMEIVAKVARSADTPVLIQGETGTGKELIAQAIHYRGTTGSKPLVTVNCAAIPDHLVESELFGYEKGAFSGAEAGGKSGLVEKAADGTLFLDEIGDLSLDAQAKILRFLENGEFYRVGGTRKFTVRTRIISATNKDLTAMIAAGAFRRDLFHRLAVIRVEIPSLSQRPGDLLPMARHFLVQFNRKFGKNIRGLTPSAAETLQAHVWTGNVRELKNVIERAVLLSNGPDLTSADLGLSMRPVAKGSTPVLSGSGLPLLPIEGLNLPGLLKDLERHYFEAALQASAGNESRAARLLGLTRDTFRYRRKNLAD